LLLVTVLKVDHDWSSTNVVWLANWTSEHELWGDKHCQAEVLL
jgi:hypothetical protein